MGYQAVMKSNFDDTGNSHSSLYMIRISDTFGPEYVEVVNDLARMTVIQCCIQGMLYMLYPAKFALLNSSFFTLLLFIWIGVLAYWLVFKKLISFK